MKFIKKIFTKYFIFNHYTTKKNPHVELTPYLKDRGGQKYILPLFDNQSGSIII